MIYTPELIKSTAPSIFATSPSSKMTNKYEFVPTDKIMEFFDREGWEISSVKQNGTGIHALHEVKFRNGQLPSVGDTLVEAIIKNSHNGMSAFSMSAGLHRLVCSNGLTVPTSVADQFRIRHKDFQLDDVKMLTESFAKKLPMIQHSVGRMMERQLTMDEKVEFVQKASKLRWATGSVPSTLDLANLLTPNRNEDEGDDLWKVFNVVQEKFVRGGVEYRSQSGRKTGLRGLKNIMAVNAINTKLWETAESMI
jgi:hypothetical protein